MPTVLRKEGFRVMIFTDDHQPPHVHAFKAGGQVKIAIGSQTIVPHILEYRGMSDLDAKAAARLVARYQAKLLKKWREYHA